MFKVSAIVSTYNSEQFIEQRLENLVNQTLYQKDGLEIIVIDSNSAQNERLIVRAFQQKFSHILYERTPQRETIYAAWNRGIKIAQGDYIINANCDDRFALDALEIMAKQLDENVKIDAVYGDWLLTKVPNDSFESDTEKFLFNYPEFFPPLFFYYQITSHAALIRKEVFSQIGVYEDRFKVFGDRDFMLRFCTSGLKAKHSHRTVGLYYENSNSLSMSSEDVIEIGREFMQLREHYLQPDNIVKLFECNLKIINNKVKLAQLYVFVGSLGKDFYQIWGEWISDLEFAGQVFTQALALNPENIIALNNQAIILCLQGQHEEALILLALGLKKAKFCLKNKIKSNYSAAQKGCTSIEDYLWLKLTGLRAKL